MYYVIQKNNPITLTGTAAFSSKPHAIHKAETLCRKTGKSFFVIELNTVYTASMLYDLLPATR